MMKAVNPATGELIREYPEHSEDEVAQRLERAGEAFASWRRFDFEERARHLTSVADLLREEMAALRPADDRGDGQADRRRRGRGREVRLGRATSTPSTPRASWPRSPWPPTPAGAWCATTRSGRCWRSCPGTSRSGRSSASRRRPSWRATWRLLKHASNVPGSALAIEAVFREAGFPDGVVTTLLISSERRQGADRPPGHPRRHAHGERPGRPGGGGRGRAAAQEDGDGARRLRPVHRAGRRRPRGDRQAGGAGTYHQLGPELHRGQAVHRGRRRRRAFRG